MPFKELVIMEIKRSEVDKSLTWDLSYLFKSDVDCVKAMEKTLHEAEAFKEKYNGKITPNNNDLSDYGLEDYDWVQAQEDQDEN